MKLPLLLERLRHALTRDEGQGMVEYALILVLIAVVVIVVLIVLGNQVQNVFCNTWVVRRPCSMAVVPMMIATAIPASGSATWKSKTATSVMPIRTASDAQRSDAKWSASASSAALPPWARDTRCR